MYIDLTPRSTSKFFLRFLVSTPPFIPSFIIRPKKPKLKHLFLGTTGKPRRVCQFPFHRR